MVTRPKYACKRRNSGISVYTSKESHVQELFLLPYTVAIAFISETLSYTSSFLKYSIKTKLTNSKLVHSNQKKKQIISKTFTITLLNLYLLMPQNRSVGSNYTYLNNMQDFKRFCLIFSLNTLTKET